MSAITLRCKCGSDGFMLYNTKHNDAFTHIEAQGQCVLCDRKVSISQQLTFDDECNNEKASTSHELDFRNP